MTQTSPTHSRLCREAKALRENLKRRKEQAKARQLQPQNSVSEASSQKDRPQ